MEPRKGNAGEGGTTPQPTPAQPAGFSVAPATPAPAQPAQPTAQAQPAAPVTIATPFGELPIGASKESILVDSPERFIALTNERLKTKYTTLAEAMEVIDNVADYRSAADRANEIQLQYNAVNENLSKLPKPVQILVEAALKNQDVNQLMARMVNSSDMDYTKPFDAHDKVKMVNRFTGASYTPESFEAMDPSTKDVLTTMARKEYLANQAEVSRQPAPQEAVAGNVAAVQASFKATIAGLTQKFPGIAQDRVSEVASVLAKGGSNPLFSNPDGTLKADAATKVAYAMYGDEMISSMQNTLADYLNRASGVQESKVLENLALSTQGQVRPASGGGTSPSSAIAQQVNDIVGFMNKGRQSFTP